MPTGFTPIVAKKVDIKIFTNALGDAVKEEVKESDKEFGKTYRTWKNQPTFDQDFSQSSREIEGSTTTSGDGSSSNPYPFVAKGTSVRYATMSPDFQAKTMPKVIGSKSGRGKVLYVNKSRPRSGIQSREFEEEIAKKEEPKFGRRAVKHLDAAIQKSGHAI